jgi:hypothetical protein
VEAPHFGSTGEIDGGNDAGYGEGDAMAADVADGYPDDGEQAEDESEETDMAVHWVTVVCCRWQPQCGDQAGNGLQAQFQFGEQHGLRVLAEGFQPAARLRPVGRVVACVRGERVAMVLVALGEALGEQQRDAGEQVAFAGGENVLEGDIELGQLLVGWREGSQGLARIAAQGCDGGAHVALVGEVVAVIGRKIGGAVGRGLRQRSRKADAGRFGGEHAIVQDGVRQALAQAGQLLRHAGCGWRLLGGRQRPGAAGEYRGERQGVREVQPLSEPFAKVVFRVRGFRGNLGEEANKCGAIEGGALQTTRHAQIRFSVCERDARLL